MKPFFVLLALLVWGHGRAEQLYLLYEASCGNRITYSRTVGDRPQMDYLAYTFTLPDGTILILETDTEGMSERDELPDTYEQCAGSLSPGIADRINTGSLQLFLLTAAEQGGYDQQPVMMASTIVRQGDRVSYTSPLTAFAFSPEDAVIGEDLDRGGEGASVYFDGREGSSCSSAFLFQQQHPSSAYPTINYKMLPQLGILEREMLGAGNYSGGDLITATAIDGRPVNDFLAALCRSEPTTQEYTEVQRSFVPYYEEAPTSDPPTKVVNTRETLPQRMEPAPAVPAPPLSTAASSTGTPPHRVASGETLYGIARRYGLSVDALKNYNGLTDNTIRPGQELIVGSPAEAPPVQIVATPPSPAPEVARPVRETPAPASYSEERRHTVQSGETVASLALRYGYTTARFREFNGLGPQEVARVGQQLKTSDCSCPPEATPEPYLMAHTDATEPSSYVSPAPYDYGRQTEVTAYPAPQQSVQIVVPPARPVTGPEVGGPPAYRPPAYDSAPVSVPTAGGSPAVERQSTYVVQQGDNLFSIARRYGTTVAELRSLNGLLPADVIVPFQKLYVN